jgi:hypothetical protein
VLTVAQVFALGDAIAPRYRALVLLATFTSLRWGELCAVGFPASDLADRAQESRVARRTFPRFAPYRKQSHGDRWGEPA